MPKALTLTLTVEQRGELRQARDHDARAYMRERAAAILKIAEGASGLQVAQQGLLKRRKPDTVYAWVHRYEAQGLGGLRIRSGRGRRPAFSPSLRRRRGR